MEPAIATMQQRFMDAYNPGVSIHASAIPWQTILQTILSLLQSCTGPQVKRASSGVLRRFMLRLRLSAALYNVDPFGDEDEAQARADAVLKVIDASSPEEIDALKASLRSAFPGVPA